MPTDTKPAFALDVTDHRAMLCIRMQAWAYGHVRYGDYPLAQRIADQQLANFDSQISDRPTDSIGYWANHYFNNFVDICTRKIDDQVRCVRESAAKGE